MATSLAAIVVGAGPAGLATAAGLKRRGIDATILEAGSGVGTSWRSHYRRLHLHTVKEHSSLPGLPFADDIPRYPSRTDLIGYLEAYAAHFGIAPRTDERVRRIAVIDKALAVETDRGMYTPGVVVVAAGMNRIPNPDRIPDQEKFCGVLRHASQYQDAAPYGGQRVLVVGAGNTGAEIALDLAEVGARPTLSVRTAVNVVPRDFLGIPTQLTSIRLRHVPLGIADETGRLVSRLAFGDLTRHGLPRPALGPISSIKLRRRIPIIDVGTIDAIKQRRIDVKPGVERLSARGATFVDGTEELFDAVVLATGYRTGLGEVIAVPGALEEDGYPTRRQRAGHPGLYFVGYNNVPTGLLREIGLEAEAVAADVAQSLTAR